MDIKKYFESIDLNEIDRFIQEGQEENLFIEFKTVVHPNYKESNKEIDKKNISKAISGFANSNGGIIVWGIKAKENDKNQDIASDKSPIKELTKFLNTLNRLEGQATTPAVIGVIHKKLEVSNDLGFIVTYVPKASLPHTWLTMPTSIIIKEVVTVFIHVSILILKICFIESSQQV